MKRFLFAFLIILPVLIYSHELKGEASWYGGKFIGRQTANGEIFDTMLYTAAHKTLPFNTIVEVTNLDNGKKTTVRINDRGPFIKGRIIDLSQKAAEDIDMVKTGTAKIVLKVIKMPKTAQVMDIQVAAYSNFTYATAMKKKLKSAGFEPKTSMSNTGIMRVMIPNVPISKSYEIVKKLEGLGIDKILIKHRG
ncbi:septal ring lytic transglycosylase RlpA family protein [Thiospirochaeta perfilievii]|uniref:Probable endolytic peptidoglycan transglycosylase RlpA n=1 Tax=Thiospirochaeta perfilievii TaxID=252967 RepID=A0A5C1QBV3_9SPIO|nr:septal ring lytic transglycosylase RlpA family protein [Thiospirochaeta perfilievii]QEN04997.1 septal ring lytic transglycosylase RlpA family protein [Thiospirochaeta perfilievii]